MSGGRPAAADSPRLQTRVEAAATTVERPLRRLVGSARANPLPHAGTISVFLFGVVVLTGIYITLFFEYGFEASYQAVADLEAHPIQRFMRAVHRYASAAMVVTTVVHAWRVFVAARFTAGRRFRWLTGVAALVLVWLAGVTGYWLIWDVRAQALGEALRRLIGWTGPGAALVGRYIGAGAGSGSSLMVVVWFLHLGLTALIGWALWRHLRRSRQAWLPPRHWMLLMAAGLVVVSVAIPAGMLAAADPALLTPDMPLDPFMLFLLPPLLGGSAAWVAMGAVLVTAGLAAVPWILRASRHDVIEIDNERCTGCELCVVDCPYLALTMADRDDPGLGAVAVVDAEACVACGICVGSCSFGAIDLAGFTAPGTIDPEGREVIVACTRHLAQSPDLGEAVAILEVGCTGAFHVQAVGDLMRRGATGVSVVGCAPGECVYGIGNDLAHQRLAGERAPHVARRFSGVASEDWVAVGDLDDAVAAPGMHEVVAATDPPAGSRPRIMAAAVVVVSLVIIGAATLLPFGGHGPGAAVRVVADHAPGSRLIGQQEPTGTSGGSTEVVIEVDGDEMARSELPTWRGAAVGVVDADVDAAEHDVRVVLVEDGVETVLHEGPANLTDGRRFIVEARDAPPPPGVAEGRRVFEDPGLGGCGVCHSTSPGDDGVGPSLAGVGDRAATAVTGLGAEEYLRESIVDPDAYVVEGYPAGQMLPIYRERLSESEVDSLVAYLMTLEESD